MAFGSFLKTCVKNTPGNRYEVYLCPTASITSVTLTSGEVSAVTMNSTAKFQRWQADLDNVQFQSVGKNKPSFMSDQTLTLTMTKHTTALHNAIYGTDGIMESATCGLVAIWVDNNGQAWIAGISPAANDGTLRPFNDVECNFDSGKAPTDDSAKPVITLKRTASTAEYPIDTTITGTITGGTATFINWTT